MARRLANDAIVALARADILAAPLKGVMLLRRWPALHGHRDLADVDLLVAPRDFVRAEESLRTLGFEATSRTNRGATLSRDDWPLSIDLHHRLFGPHLFDMATDEVLNRAVQDDSLFASPVLRLSDADLFAHVVGHAVKSRRRLDAGSALADVAWLLDTLTIDPISYSAHLRASRLERAAGYVLKASPLEGFLTGGAIVRHLRLDLRDRWAIEAARARPEAYWVPHLLNGGVARGSRSFSVQVRQDLGWRARRWFSSRTRA